MRACYGRGKQLSFELYDNMLPGDCGSCDGLGYYLSTPDSDKPFKWVIGEQTFEVIQ